MELVGDSPEQMGSGITVVFEAVLCAGAKRRSAGQMQRSWLWGAASVPHGGPGHGRDVQGHSGTHMADVGPGLHLLSACVQQNRAEQQVFQGIPV